MSNYNFDWQPYTEYEKQEYDIKLKDGRVVFNCYPNAGKFHSHCHKYNGQVFEESEVAEIRLSHIPIWNINGKYAQVVDFSQFDKEDLIKAKSIWEDDMPIIIFNGGVNQEYFESEVENMKLVNMKSAIYSQDITENRRIRMSEELYSYLSENRRSVNQERELIIHKKSKLSRRLRDELMKL
jgi:hypothetical protein